MRILIVTELFPPHYFGGAEVCCGEMAEILKSQGHDVHVLTSRPPSGLAEKNEAVNRVLIRSFPWRRYPENSSQLKEMFLREITNQSIFKQAVRRLRPDCVYFWKLDTISLSLPQVLDRRVKAVHFVFDTFSFEWWLDAWRLFWAKKPVLVHNRLFKKILKRILNLLGFAIPENPYEFRNAHFASQFLRDGNPTRILNPENTRVIHWGVNLGRFYPAPASGNECRILYTGRIIEHKGIDTAVNAFKKVAAVHPECTLTIVGANDDPPYEKGLRQWVQREGLEEKIVFKGFIDRRGLAEIYREHGIFIFPSLVEEGFGMTLLEAMASGLAVVTSAQGGSLEIGNGETDCLFFEKANADACAKQVLRLLNDRAFCSRVRAEARKTVEAKFSSIKLEQTVQEAFEALSSRG